jgi:hypothetical protein
LRRADSLSKNVRNAVELRRGEKRILLFALSRYQRQLKRLEKEAGSMGRTTVPAAAAAAEEEEEEEEEEDRFFQMPKVRMPKKKKKRKRDSRRRTGEDLSGKSEL